MNQGAKEGEILISVIIPAYNEEERIEQALLETHSYFQGKAVDFEIVVVSDGSTDDTEQVVRRLSKEKSEIRLVTYQQNRGKGFAVRTGVSNAKGSCILISDADLATPIEEAEKFVEHIEDGYDVVLASRALPDSQIIGWRPWYRVLAGKVFNRMVQWLAVPGIVDTQCGFKMFTKESARTTFSQAKIDGFAFDVEILFLALKQGYRLLETPVRWQNSPRTKVSMIKDTLRMSRDIMKVRINDWRKKYESGGSGAGRGQL